MREKKQLAYILCKDLNNYFGKNSGLQLKKE